MSGTEQSTMPSAIRAFIAIPLPPEIVARLTPSVEELRAVCRTAKVEARWSRPEGWHLTLKFLGAVSRVDPLLGRLPVCAARHTAFSLHFNGFGVFPDARRPRVLWIGLEPDEGVRALDALAREVDQATAELGYPGETRPFSPHLTVARVRSERSSPDLAAWVERHVADRLGSIRVERMALMRSDTGPGGSVYTPVAVFPLA